MYVCMYVCMYVTLMTVMFRRQFAEVEDPVRRKVNNVAWTGATTKGCETMRKMRGLSVLPQQLDFGVLKEGCTYSFNVGLQNTGIDACRFRVRQPPPSTGIRVLFKPGPVIIIIIIIIVPC